MKRALLPVVFLAGLAGPALAASQPRTSGDAVIDAQWAAQLRLPPAVNGTAYPIDLSGRRPRNVYEIVVAPRAAGVARPAVHTRVIDTQFLPAEVDYPTDEVPGTVVIDSHRHYLFLVLGNRRAQRYGVGVGREGFGWTGTVRVGRKSEWPAWTPPGEMRKRQPYLPVSMEGGPDNPLGARAMYLYDGDRDTLFRIHGSNEPWTIGHNVSSGCFRMRNEDVTDLYRRIVIGAKVVVI